MATITLYPAEGANSPVDGTVYAGTGSGSNNKTFTTIRNQVTGANVLNTFEELFVALSSDDTANFFWNLYRSAVCFDTSSIPDNAVINSATLFLKGSYKANDMGGSPALHVCSVSLASTSTVAVGDYDAFGDVSFGNVTYAAFAVGAFNEISLNASGISAINKSGITQLGLRLSWDLDNSFGGTWVSLGGTDFGMYSADQVGPSEDPRLVINYTPVLVVQDAVHSHSPGNVILPQHRTTGTSIYGGWGSSIVGVSYFGSGSNVTEADTLQVNSIPLAHTADNVILVQDFKAIVQDAIHNHLSDNVILTQKHSLTVQDALHAHTADSPAITEKDILAGDDALHAHTAEPVILVQKHTLQVEDTLHAHTVESLIIVHHQAVVVNDSLHSVSSDSVVLTQKHYLVSNDGYHTHIAEATSVLFQLPTVPGLIPGVYQPDVTGTGNISASGAFDSGVYQPDNPIQGSYEPAEIETGSWTAP